MKVTGYQTRILHTPADDSLANSLPDTGRQRAFVTLEMTTDEGVDGVGLTFVPALSASPVAGALRTSVDALADMTIGEDPHGDRGHRCPPPRGNLRRRPRRPADHGYGRRRHGPVGHQGQGP